MINKEIQRKTSQEFSTVPAADATPFVLLPGEA
jgi:hypothetical protein